MGFKPGQSGNPGGKKPGIKNWKPFSEEVKGFLNARPSDDELSFGIDGSGTRQDALIRRLFQIALSGEKQSDQIKAAEVLINRADGTPKQSVEVANNGAPAVLVVAPSQLNALDWDAMVTSGSDLQQPEQAEIGAEDEESAESSAE